MKGMCFPREPNMAKPDGALFDYRLISILIQLGYRGWIHVESRQKAHGNETVRREIPYLRAAFPRRAINDR